MIDDLRLERARQRAQAAIDAGHLRFDRLALDLANQPVMIVTMPSQGQPLEFHVRYAPASDGQYHLTCGCPAAVYPDLVCDHVGALVASGFNYCVSEVTVVMLQNALAGGSEDGCPRVWRDALDAAEQGEELYHWPLGD